MTNQTPSTPRSEKRDEPPRRGGGRARMVKLEKASDPRRALARLLPYLKPFLLPISLVMVLVVVYTLLGLLGPYLMGRAIDQFIGGKDTAGLLNIALLMLVTYILNNVFQAAASWVMSRISQEALKKLRRDLFDHIQSLSIGFFDTPAAIGPLVAYENCETVFNRNRSGKGLKLS